MRTSNTSKGRKPSGDIGEVPDDMLFSGGKLHVKLLGDAQELLEE